jgi:hypothetical protein
MHQPVAITIPVDGSPFSDEISHLIPAFIAGASDALEEGHSAEAVSAALSFAACLVAGQKPDSEVFLKYCQRLARRYRNVKLSS